MKLATAFSVLAFGLMVTVGAAPALAQDELEDPLGSPWYTNALGWSLAGVGAASLIVGGVLWSEHKSRKNTAEQCTAPPPTCPSFEERLEIAESAQDFETPAASLFGIGGALVIGGIVAFVLASLSPSENKEENKDENKDEYIYEEDKPSALQLRGISPIVGAKTGGVGAMFSF